MNRREILKASLALPATVVMTKHSLAESVDFAPKPGAWRTFDIVTQIDLPAANQGSQAWIPLPSLETDWARTISNTWSGNATSFDWSLLRGRRWAKPWMLSGGLTAESVAEAVRIAGASAVDVSSGVEDRPGHKTPALIAAFIAAARGG